MNESKVILTAAWVAPISRPLIRDGAVFFRDGKIAAVGPAKSLKDEMKDATVLDAGNAVILPGLVNAHTHLELTNIKRGPQPVRFVDWIIDLMKQPPPSDGVQAGIQQCLKFGITAIGDITSQPDVSRPILVGSPLRGVSYGEVRAMATRRHFLEPRLSTAIETATVRMKPPSRSLRYSEEPDHAPKPSGSSEYLSERPGSAEISFQSEFGNLQPGITPHAPYSIESAGYIRCLQAAREMNLPLATHLAETPDEALFLADHTGPFRELWNVLNAWDDQVPKFIGGPIRLAKSLGLLDYPTLLAHVNYCDDDEMNLLKHGQASVVYCPRTHAFFDHPPHRWREMLALGINVAIGTDSCASSPDLNLVDDLRLLHNLAPEVDVGVLWAMATTHAAKAIQRDDIGALEPGNAADAAFFPITGNDPLREILESSMLPVSVWIAGAQS